jgi:hypothetical protein
VAGATRAGIADAVERVLFDRPRLNKHQVLEELRRTGWRGLSTSLLNAIMYEHPERFERSCDALPVWSLVGGSALPGEASSPALGRHTSGGKVHGLDLRAWQSEALAAWRSADYVGVVEAVTGSGKTAVGIAAAAEAIAAGRKVLILVPGRDLMHQWRGHVARCLTGVRTGLFGDGASDELSSNDLVISTVQSACKHMMLASRHEGLLVADEVHRYGASVIRTGRRRPREVPRPVLHAAVSRAPRQGHRLLMRLRTRPG